MSAERRWPVIETFGPTIQGEGPEAGLPCCFVRFGGCDYRCSWCDSMYAVEPAEVRAHSRMMTALELAAALPARVPRVILSGGNPALLQLGPLVDVLHDDGRMISVETQGSVWRDWLAKVDMLVVSPKPPSSGMVTPEHEAQTAEFIGEAKYHNNGLALKIVVFDQADYDWARELLLRWPSIPGFLSAGTPQGVDTIVLEEVACSYQRLCELVAGDPALGDVRVLPQLHVIAWGTARGV